MNEKIYPRALTQSYTDIQPETIGNGLISVKLASVYDAYQKSIQKWRINHEN